MAAAYIYALSTFVAGFLLLLAWIYLTAENPGSNRMLVKSVGLFLLPGIALALVPARAAAFPLSLYVATFIEECLKATAASTEQNHSDRFWLVILFGVWELMLVKPAWGINHATVLQDSSFLGLVGLAAGSLLPVLMHGVTAEIYAFRFGGRIPAALLASWVLHSAYDELANVSLVVWLLLFLPLLLLFLALWPTGHRIASPRRA